MIFIIAECTGNTRQYDDRKPRSSWLIRQSVCRAECRSFEPRLLPDNFTNTLHLVLNQFDPLIHLLVLRKEHWPMESFKKDKRASHLKNKESKEISLVSDLLGKIR